MNVFLQGHPSLRQGLLLVALALSALACSPLKVVRQAEPNPLVGQPRYSLRPMDHEGVDIVGKTYQEYLEHVGPESRRAFPGDLKRMKQGFRDELVGTLGILVYDEPPKEGDFRLTPRLVFLEPGYWGGIQEAVVKIQVLVVDDRGEVVDEVIVKGDSGKATTTIPIVDLIRKSQTGGRAVRMKLAGQRAAEVLAKYLYERQGGE